MNVRPGSTLVFVFATLQLQAADSKACADLLSYQLPAGSITKAEFVQSGSTPEEASLPPFCRISATLKPSSDSDVKMELWLPDDWNGKLEGNGNGGWTGSI